MSDDDPEELLARLAAGDRSAFASLFSQYRDRLWRMVHFRLDTRLQGRIDADDVVQEIFLDAVKRLDAWLADPSRSLFVWLRLIAGQTMIDLHRRHLGAKVRNADQEVDLLRGSGVSAQSASLSAHLLGDLTSPSQAAMRAEAAQQLEDVLEAMDGIDREVLVLRHFEELSNKEVADVLGISENAASNRYVRALGRLRGILAPLRDPDEH